MLNKIINRNAYRAMIQIDFKQYILEVFNSAFS